MNYLSERWGQVEKVISTTRSVTRVECCGLVWLGAEDTSSVHILGALPRLGILIDEEWIWLSIVLVSLEDSTIDGTFHLVFVLLHARHFVMKLLIAFQESHLGLVTQLLQQELCQNELVIIIDDEVRLFLWHSLRGLNMRRHCNNDFSKCNLKW